MLGLTFKWGALVGWAAVTGSLSLAALVLYAGSVLWTIGYDTIYAHQDKEDDLLVGLKSTALRFGAATQRWLTGFYAGAVLLWSVAGVLAGAQLGFFAGARAWWRPSSPGRWRPSTRMTRQLPARFKSNQLVGGRFFSASWPTWRGRPCSTRFEAA